MKTSSSQAALPTSLLCETMEIIPTHPKADTSALVVFCYQNEKDLGLDLKTSEFPEAQKLIVESHKQKRFKGAAKETVIFRSCHADQFAHVLAVGLGSKKAVNEESLRIAMAIAVKTLTKEKIQNAAVALQSVRRLTRDAVFAGQAFAEGALLALYKFDALKSKNKDKEDGSHDNLNTVVFVLNDKAALKKFSAGVERGKILAEATFFARDLGNAPGNYLTPTEFANRVGQAVKGLPVKFQAFDKKKIESLKMGCFLGVNKGSTEEPRFMVLEYFGGPKSEKPVILVGKGITFDTGGISIKPSAAMEEMKFDMCGGAAVAGATLALAKLQAKVNVVCLIPSTDNMPDGGATRPGDVLVAMNGKTVEVNNTDAEGRLILADALSYACENYEPRAIIDAATLTGACVVALGNVFTGVFTKDEALLKKISHASEITGEKVWRMPLTNEYADDMKGAYADICNMALANSKGGGASHAAGFLSYFVSENIPWAHFDIAGTAWHGGSRSAYNPDKGASGVAVRLFAELVQNL